MRRRLVTLLITVVLITTPMFGCDSTEKSDESALTCSFSIDENGVPENVEIEVDEFGRKRWKHGNHYHYIDEEKSQEPQELLSSDIISEYCLENDIPSECVLEKLNIESSYLDMSVRDLAVILGFETFDIKMIIKNCK